MNKNVFLSIFCIILFLTSGITIIPKTTAEQITIDEEQTQHSQTLQMGYAPTDITIAKQGIIADKNYITKIEIYSHTTSTYSITAGLAKKVGESYIYVGSATHKLQTGWNTFDFNCVQINPMNEYFIMITTETGKHADIGFETGNPYTKNGLNPYMSYWQEGWVDKSDWDISFKAWGYNTNSRPDAPNLDSPVNGKKFIIQPGETLDVTLEATATDPDGEDITYRFWDDDTNEIIGTTAWKQSGEQGTAIWENLQPGTYTWYARAGDWKGFGSKSNTFSFTIESQGNHPPDAPSKPSGPNTGMIGETLSFSTSTTDPDGDSLVYRYDWDDGDISNWGGKTRNHIWNTFGTYTIKAQAKDEHGEKSSWSSGKTITINEESDNQAPFIPSNPSPNDNSDDVDYICNFSWDGGDPDGDDVTYDVYVNCYPEPDAFEPYIQDLEKNYCEIMLLSDWFYYWKIVSTDSNGKTTEGPVWSFDTKENNNNDGNNPPNKPSRPTLVVPGSDQLNVGDWCIIGTTCSDPNDDPVNLYWDMDEDGIIDYQQMNITSGVATSIFYIWDKPAGLYNVRVVATDVSGRLSNWSEKLFLAVNPSEYNNPPRNTTIPGGISKGYIEEDYTFYTFSNDLDNDQIKYKWDFGDGTIIDWDDTNWIDSGEIAEHSHTWNKEGTYYIRVKAKDSNGAETPWSGYKKVEIENRDITIFNTNDLMFAAEDGDFMDKIIGQDRIADANYSTKTVISGAFGGVNWNPIWGTLSPNHAWSAACQGIKIYVGRPKKLTIKSDISLICNRDQQLPSYTAANKIIRIGQNFRVPEKEFTSYVKNTAPFDDLVAFCEGAIPLVGATSAFKPHEIIELSTKIEKLERNNRFIKKLWYNKYEKMISYGAWDFDDPLIKNKYYKIASKGEYFSGASPIKSWDIADDVATKSKSLTTKTKNLNNQGVQTVEGAVAAYLIITAVFNLINLWKYYGPEDLWGGRMNIDSLLNMYEEKGKAATETIKAENINFDKGEHFVWSGLKSDAWGGGVWLSFTSSVGMVRSITIDGIAPPYKPTMQFPDQISRGQQIKFKPYCRDPNDDPIKYIINWGDGSTDTTDFFPSETEGEIYHTYQNTGEYTITIYAKDCDRMESDTVTYQITVYQDDSNPEVIITQPENNLYIHGRKLIRMYQPFIIGDIKIEADAQDSDSWIKEVEFIIDGQTKHIDFEYPYEFTWNTKGIGSYNLMVRVKDSSGKTAIDTKKVFYFNII